MHRLINFQKQNNRSWVVGDAVIYWSWHVVTMRSLRLLASWPRELIATVVGVATVEEVVAVLTKWRKAPGSSSSKKLEPTQLLSSSSELVLEAHWHFLASLLRIGLGPIPSNGARNAMLASPSKDTMECQPIGI
jgi:hypothetical protein